MGEIPTREMLAKQRMHVPHRVGQQTGMRT